MNSYYLTFTLQSDTAFGRGDGVAGWIDQEVQHDRYGCPYLGGKALKGMLVNECADILAALPPATATRWQAAARYLFGQPGSTTADAPRLQIGDACLPAGLRQALQEDLESAHPALDRLTVLQSLTTLRRQTAVDDTTGVAQDSSLRTIRVILRETHFEAQLHFAAADVAEEAPDALALLAACLKALRRVGTSRNRGLGRLRAVHLEDGSRNPVTDHYFTRFCTEVQA
jgi:CRISPR/Cas system CSM-associated protein Csm3 (group 7 of RAMP superfamily)